MSIGALSCRNIVSSRTPKSGWSTPIWRCIAAEVSPTLWPLIRAPAAVQASLCASCTAYASATDMSGWSLVSGEMGVRVAYASSSAAAAFSTEPGSIGPSFRRLPPSLPLPAAPGNARVPRGGTLLLQWRHAARRHLPAPRRRGADRVPGGRRRPRRRRAGPPQRPAQVHRPPHRPRPRRGGPPGTGRDAGAARPEAVRDRPAGTAPAGAATRPSRTCRTCGRRPGKPSTWRCWRAPRSSTWRSSARRAGRACHPRSAAGPAHVTGVGKAILAFSSPDAVQAVLDAGLAKASSRSVAAPACSQRNWNGSAARASPTTARNPAPESSPPPAPSWARTAEPQAPCQYQAGQQKCAWR